MALYSYKGAWPTNLPNRISLSDGTTRTDKETFTSEQIVDAGWIEVADAPIAQYPNKLEWVTETLSWNIREPNESEINSQWNIIKAECEKRLSATDYKVIKAYELGIPVDDSYKTYRQELRDLYNNVNNVDPWNIVWPFIVVPDTTPAI